MLCLEAGKNVLCEKALTVNATQARKLFETAKAKGLFLMEAVWTRYFPLSIKVRELVTSGAIGKVHRVFADLSFAFAKGGREFDVPQRAQDDQPRSRRWRALGSGYLFFDLGFFKSCIIANHYREKRRQS